jgi:serine/threonine protein kinase
MNPKAAEELRSQASRTESQPEIHNEDLLKRYDCIGSLGFGTYGSVYKLRDKSSGALVAVKKIHHFDSDDFGLSNSALREVSLLRALGKQPFVIELKEVHQSPYALDPRFTELYLVFEYMECDLGSYIYSDQKKPMDAGLVKSYLYQLTAAVHLCHVRKIVHRDIKPWNLLVDQKGLLKLADFGLSRNFRMPIGRMTPGQQTILYRAPEILLGMDRYSTAVDVWSIGCVFAEMVLMRPLFQSNNEISLLELIFRILGTPTEADWPELSQLRVVPAALSERCPGSPLEKVVPGLEGHGIDLLRRMLSVVPSRRITAYEALQHPFFTEDDLILELRKLSKDTSGVLPNSN